MMKKKLIVTAIIATLGISGFALAGNQDCKDRGEYRGYGHHDRMFSKMREHLDLTDEQAAQIESLKESNDSAGPAHRKQMFKDMMALNPEDADYSQQVEKFATEQAEIVKQKIISHAQLRAKIHSILTPEQREKAIRMHNKKSDS